MHISDFNSEAFLRDYWQKKPLLIKNPWDNWENPLEPNELAGLACEAEVESRLIEQTDASWAVEHGPLPEARFATLGPSHWTLLVQAVDHYVQEVAALIEPFRFIPSWRIDDVMVSCAADQGGVGPHFDQYDVFLIQGSGRRRWRIGGRCDETSALLPHDDLRLLAAFEAKDEWILEPGDILYVPPGIAHDGVAIGDNCMTYSIGFRAPSRSELIGDWCDDLLGEMATDDRYSDPDLPLQANPGEISEAAIEQLHAMVAETLYDRDRFARWLGRYVSTPKYPDMDWRPDAPIAPGELRTRCAAGDALCRNPASRFSYIGGSGDTVSLFVDGKVFACRAETAAFAQQLCTQSQFTLDTGQLESAGLLALVAALFNQGSLAFG
ncbi:cupin domain-containing protein [Parasphingopyxis lamellibrachiae]|uniref:50S ribosomal protein L16 3-hydroxylase n=1 Tax=Parasphingopyxis lamellibrachiae TaxID=680125 RepID=A0A3D9FE85_9SPHN|nr:cupin domain-containing protein [Parasphingopyxis lamellibrachiae]RED15897.1 50S ribosomal protein L16 3-hydroxylase [Parasphingopyxis lamellibrachiae]